MITHHLSDECLLEYAAGSLPEADLWSLQVILQCAATVASN